MVWKAKTELPYLLVRGLPSMVEHFLSVAFPGRRLVASRVDKGGAVTCVVEAHGGRSRGRLGQEWPAAATTTLAHPSMGQPGRASLCADEVAAARQRPEGQPADPHAPGQAALEVRWVYEPGHEIETLPML